MFEIVGALDVGWLLISDETSHNNSFIMSLWLIKLINPKKQPSSIVNHEFF